MKKLFSFLTIILLISSCDSELINVLDEKEKYSGEELELIFDNRVWECSEWTSVQYCTYDFKENIVRHVNLNHTVDTNYDITNWNIVYVGDVDGIENPNVYKFKLNTSDPKISSYEVYFTLGIIENGVIHTFDVHMLKSAGWSKYRFRDYNAY